MGRHSNIARCVSSCFALTLLMSGCSLAPTYHAPLINISSDAWQNKVWQVAQPVDNQPHGAWWQIYGDPVLNELESHIEAANPTLAAALARYNQANAYTAQLRSGLAPSVDAGSSLTNNRQSDNRPLRGTNQPNVFDANSVGLSANYTLDIWDLVHNQVAAGEANAQASAADLQTIRISLQAQLADNYISLRGTDAEVKLLTDAVSAYRRALELTQRRHAGGIVSGLDVSRAQTQLSSVEAQLDEIQSRRAIYEHAIASLIGTAAMNFSVPTADHPFDVPNIPVGIPSTLLQRRPDISAAERRTAAANATIGVARAAYYPNFSLGAVYGYQNTGKAGLLTAPNTFWSLGPSVLLNLFDAGKHDAELAQARAEFDLASAQYRSTVLGAFQQVEDDLAQLKFGKQGELKQQAALAAAEKTLDLSLNRYREGAVNYLDVVIAQTAALSAERSALELHTQQLRASVDLVRALGGSWESIENK